MLLTLVLFAYTVPLSEANKKRNWYPHRVRCVHLEMKGKDGQTHGLTLQASSLFDAAAKALDQWSKLWWFDQGTLLTVRSGDVSRVN
jgi:hypothetical protein